MNTQLDPNVEAVRELLKQRAAVGLKKYGVTTERTDWTRLGRLRHALAEACDLAVYLQAEISIAEKELSVQQILERSTPMDNDEAKSAYDAMMDEFDGFPSPAPISASFQRLRVAAFMGEIRNEPAPTCKCGVEPCVCDGEEAQPGVPWWLIFVCLLCVLSPVLVLVYELWKP